MLFVAARQCQFGDSVPGLLTMRSPLTLLPLQCNLKRSYKLLGRAPSFSNQSSGTTPIEISSGASQFSFCFTDIPQRIRVITADVTGTLVSFKGSLSEHYLGSAAKCGVDIPPDAPFSESFTTAYRQACRDYPCFGGNLMTAREWWRYVVLQSFELSGIHLQDKEADDVFSRIYSVFGSHAAYDVFDDAIPFLQWARHRKILCGVASNADERYGDGILPMLGLTQGDHLEFLVFSKTVGCEKPEAQFFAATREHAEDAWRRRRRVEHANEQELDKDPLLPSQILHLGNDFAKDYEGAKQAGHHALLLNRYGEDELAEEWESKGAHVCTDLMCVVEYLGRMNCQLG